MDVEDEDTILLLVLLWRLSLWFTRLASAECCDEIRRNRGKMYLDCPLFDELIGRCYVSSKGNESALACIHFAPIHNIHVTTKSLSDSRLGYTALTSKLGNVRYRVKT